MNFENLQIMANFATMNVMFARTKTMFYTACPNIRKIRQEQFNEPKVVNEMEAKGYGSKKN